MTEHCYMVAGLRFVLELPSFFDVDSSLPSFRDFRCDADSRPDFRMVWDGDLTLPQDAVQLAEESNDMGTTRIGRAGNLSYLDFRFDGCEALLCLSDDYCDGRFRIDLAHRSAGILISSALRCFFAQNILLHKGLSLHASCVVRDGEGYLFMGRSGTGKSTHSRLWIEAFPGTELLNDDNPAVRILPDGPRVFGTPWSGKTDCWRNLSAPLCGIVRLRQAPFDSFEPLDEIQAFSEVYPGCSVLRSDAFLHERLCDNLEMLCSLVKVGRMACLPDLEAARICAAGIATL